MINLNYPLVLKLSMTLTKNKITSITIATILILSATTLATPAFADDTSETLFFTTFGGGQNVHSVDVTFTLADPSELAQGVTTASAGNMAQGVAWRARELGIPCRVIVPDHAPRAKLDAVEALGAEVVAVTFDEWWRVIVEHTHPESRGLFIHPVCDPDVMAGNGTIGLELLEDLPDVDAVVVPFGGGGLSSGIASALRAKRPEVSAPPIGGWNGG